VFVIAIKFALQSILITSAMASKECVGKADGKRPRVTNALKNAISSGILSEENPAVMFFDISRYDSNLTKVVEGTAFIVLYSS
jgi:hypothetical protein